MAKPIFTVYAPTDEVRELLSTQMSPADFKLLNVANPADDPFNIRPNRDIEQFITVVEFAANAVAGGVLYDVVKRAYEVLKNRYGNRVEKHNDKNDDEPEQPA